MVGFAAQAGHDFAGAPAIELPAVVVTLDIAFDDSAGGERRVPMCAAIDKRDTLSARVAKCNQW
jgi:hypothetical protein